MTRTLQSAIERVLPRLRAEAVARMTSRADVYRKAGETTQQGDEPVTNERTLVLVNVPVRITGAPRSRETGPAGARHEEGAREAHFPIGTDVHDDDLILLTAGENAGDVWRLVDVARMDQKTALRMQVEAADASDLEA